MAASVTGPSAFRRLWQPPARYADRARDRRVTFLELFFDLVFVVVVSQLAHRLAEHPSWSGVAVLLVSAVLSLGVGLTGWGAKASLGAMVLLLLAPVATGLLVWLRHTEPGSAELG